MYAAPKLSLVVGVCAVGKLIPASTVTVTAFAIVLADRLLQTPLSLFAAITLTGRTSLYSVAVAGLVDAVIARPYPT